MWCFKSSALRREDNLVNPEMSASRILANTVSDLGSIEMLFGLKV